jgi:hypothetical protein
VVRCPDCKTILDCGGEQGAREGAWHVEWYRCGRCRLTVYVEKHVDRDDELQVSET